MVEILKAILFGILEGVTEWLPVSSTGHLILLDGLIGLQVSDAVSDLFEVTVQLSAVMAVVCLFFRKLCPLKDQQQRKEVWELWSLVALAVMPSGILGILLDDWLEETLHGPFTVAAMLILYGIAFLLVERRAAPVPPGTRRIGLKTALLIGCFQALSLVPGTSRSGATILGAMLLGVDRSAAAEFSFFMAVPTMLGAGAVRLAKFVISGAGITGLEIGILLTGCAVSFLVSLLVIRGLMDYVKERSFAVFGVYRIVLGILILGCFVFVK